MKKAMSRVGGLIAAGAVALSLAACGNSAGARPDVIPEGGAEIDVFTLRVGDCFEHESFGVSDEIETVKVVNCDEPHDAEVYYSHMIAGEKGADFPGSAEVVAEGEEVCLGSSFENYVGTDYWESTIYANFLHPQESSWDMIDDREILCYLIFDEYVTGSYQGSNL